MSIEDRIAAETPRLRRYALGLTGDRAAADDLVQDTVERALRRTGQYRGEGPLGAWLFRILNSLFVSEARRSARRREIAARAFDPPIDRGDGPEAALFVNDILRALGQLPADQRQVLLLVAVEQQSYRATAEILDIPVGTVMSRLARAREKLHHLRQGEDGPARIRRVK